MNYEQIVEARQNADPRGLHTPLGSLVRRKTDAAWQNELQLNAQLKDSVPFACALQHDMEQSRLLHSRQQLTFAIESDDAGPYALQLGKMALTTLEHYLSEHPAELARKGYIDSVLADMAQLSAEAAAHDMLLVCMHPALVMVRQTDGRPLSLLHGSCYAGNAKLMTALYGEVSDSVAPEVMNGEKPTAAADTYALAWLAQWLYGSAAMPIGAKGILARALSTEPIRRQPTPQALMKALAERRSTLRSLMAMTAALMIAAAAVWVYVEMVPETTVVEFVKPVENDPMAATLEDTIIIEDLKPGDTVRLSPREQKMLQQYSDKAEAIFRKRFSKEADRILSNIYNRSSMTGDREKFVAGSVAGASELDELEKRLAEEAGITDVRGQKLASEIIDQLTKQKLEKLKESKQD